MFNSNIVHFMRCVVVIGGQTFNSGTSNGELDDIRTKGFDGNDQIGGSKNCTKRSSVVHWFSNDTLTKNHDKDFENLKLGPIHARACVSADDEDTVLLERGCDCRFARECVWKFISIDNKEWRQRRFISIIREDKSPFLSKTIVSSPPCWRV